MIFSLKHSKVPAFLFLLAILSLAVFNGCKRNPLDVKISNIDLDFEISRFEKELFSMDMDSLPEKVQYLSLKYDDFLDVFSFHIISIGLPSESAYAAYLGMFISDRLNREVYDTTMSVFNDLTQLENTFTNAFKRYKYHFPEKDIPQVVSYISRFNYPHFTVGNYIGIGLDMYLGTENEYYSRMGLPRYQVQNMFREKIPSDAFNSFGNSVLPYTPESDNLLSRMIHQGKIMYFVDALLPDQPDSLKIGFSLLQMKWCQNNEKQMWEYLIENKLLFSTEAMVMQKILGPAPFTSFFTSESPGRTGIWIGWQLVRSYAAKNKNLSVADILNETDYQKILRESGYNP
jgi:hypothetical protein